MSQQISAIGQVATEPKFFASENGVPFCTFRLASTERRFDSQKNEWVDGDTNWFTINAFRTLATHAKESFSTGDRIVVSGRLRVKAWTKDEKKGTSVEIDADGLGHDIRWGVSKFSKQAAKLEDPMSPAPDESSVSPESSRPSAFAAPSGSPGTGDSREAFSADGFTPNVEAA